MLRGGEMREHDSWTIGMTLRLVCIDNLQLSSIGNLLTPEIETKHVIAHTSTMIHPRYHSGTECAAALPICT
jgi:hypothetical protein